MIRATLVCALVAALLAAGAAAITNGTPDGTAHPYVGIAVSGDVFCSGTLLSPTVFLTAGHCTDAFASTGEPTFVTTDPNASPTSVYVTGTPNTQPGFFNIPPQGVGVPASVGSDLGIVVLDTPIAASRYAQLPTIGAVTGGASVALVGYGAQGSVPAAHGRRPTFTFLRTRATATVINDKNTNGDQFVRVSTNPGRGQGGIGPGDSGAPAILADDLTIGAIGSHGASPLGDGTAYFSRLDTAAAHAFIDPFLK
jgi:trypsin